MKRFLLSFAVLSFVALSANAQQSRELKNGKSQMGYRYQAQQVIAPATVNEAAPKAQAANLRDVANNLYNKPGKVAKAEVSAIYDYPMGVLFQGPFFQEDADGGYFSYYLQSNAYVKGRKDYTWTNYSSYDTAADVTFEWTSGTNAMEQDEDGNGIASMWGGNYVPTLKVIQGEQIATYQYSFNYQNKDYPGAWFSNTSEDEIFMINGQPQNGFYTGWSNGAGWYGNAEFFGQGKKAVGLAQSFEATDAHVYASAVRAMFTSNVADREDPLCGGTLTATVYTIGEDGSLTEFISADATAENIAGNCGDGRFVLDFPFVDEDELMGTVQTPVVLPNEPLFVAVTGFESVSDSLKFYMFDANGFAGHAYGILEDGNISSLYYTNSQVPAWNIALGFLAIQPDVELAMDEGDAVEFPVEGGVGVTAQGTDSEGNPVEYNDVDFYSSVGKDMYTIAEQPEWVTEIEFDETYFENGWILVYMSAEALPEGVEGRSGEVIFEVYGKEFSVPVVQGQVNGIEEIATDKRVRDNRIFNLAGQQVGKNYKGVVIENGHKYIRK